MKRCIHTKKHNNQSGFTLIEMLVSLALFASVVTIATSTLLALIDANAKSQNMQDVITNLSFAVDSISREIRTGSGYVCGDSLQSNIEIQTTSDCGKGTVLSLIEGGSSLTGTQYGRIAYRYNDADQSIERRIGSGEWKRLTAESVQITEMYFTVTNTDPFDASNRSGDMKQPRVRIFISGTAGDLATVDATFTIQTTVTQRARDIKYR